MARIFPYSDWIIQTEWISAFSPNTGKYGPEKTRSREVLKKELSKISTNKNDAGFERFFRVSLEVLERFAPKKKKYIRRKTTTFMNKNLKKEIIKSSKQRNKRWG